MRKITGLIALGLVLVVLTAGCGGVLLNAKYSQILNETESWAQETANRAEAGTLSDQEKTNALRSHATMWREFRNARDGVSEGGDS